MMRPILPAPFCLSVSSAERFINKVLLPLYFSLSLSLFSPLSPPYNRHCVKVVKCTKYFFFPTVKRMYVCNNTGYAGRAIYTSLYRVKSNGISCSEALKQQQTGVGQFKESENL